MSNKQQTSVEFAVEKLAKLIPSGNQLVIRIILEQAKAMHKEQMLDIWSDGNDYSSIQKEEFEQYYKETYENSKD